jgi:hypothetical protein
LLYLCTESKNRRMELNEIKAFLHTRKGYLKEGGKRLRKVLLNKGFETTVSDCKQAIREVCQELRGNQIKKTLNEGKILIYDIETSPNLGWFWKAGYKQNIGVNQILEERKVICVSYKWLGEDQVYNLTWDKNKDDKFLLEQFISVLNEANLIVAHNGDNFDLKWLRTRALVHKIKMLPNYKQFDTLKIARNKLYLNSNRLDYISKLLGFEGKINISPEVWSKVILLNDKDALNEMLDYCDEDVRQLEKVYNELKYIENPYFHAGVLNGEIKSTSPISGSVDIEHVKSITTSAGTIKHIMRDLETQRFFEMSDSNYRKFLEINN